MSVGGRGDARRRFRARFHWWELVKKGGGGLLVYFWWRWPIFASIRKKFFRRFEMEWIDLEFDQFWKRMIFFFQLMYNRVDHVRSLFEFWNPLTFPGTKNFLVPAPPLPPPPNVSRPFCNSYSYIEVFETDKTNLCTQYARGSCFCNYFNDGHRNVK